MEMIYQDNLEHIKDELKRLDLILQRAVFEIREHSKDNELSGIYISEEEVDSILLKGLDGSETAGIPEKDSLVYMIQQQTDLIEERVKESIKMGVDLQILNLARKFKLSPFEMDVILVCLAPELDPRYHRLYGYLQDNAIKKHPSIGLILNLFCLGFEEKIYARDFFSMGSHLQRYRLISFVKDSPETSNHFPAQMLKLEERITDFLLMSDRIDSRISPCCSLIPLTSMRHDPTLSGDIECKITSIITSYIMDKAGGQPLLYFSGPDSEGKRTMAESVCSSIDIPLLQADIRALLKDGKEFERLLCIILREGLMQEAAVYLDHIDCLWTDEEAGFTFINTMQALFCDMGSIIFLSGEGLWPDYTFSKDYLFFEFEFPIPSYPVRKGYWKFSLNGHHPLNGDIDISCIAGKFRFTRSQIRDAVLVARNRAILRDGKDFKITGDDLNLSARILSNQRLLTFGRKITPKYTWEDIVLPEDMLSQLKELCCHVTFHGRVYGEWGFDRKHTLGKGLNILFSGQSGTGKTMAAEIIANELKLDLYKIDLSTVVSKYIGETEKNLSRIFKEAETSNAILFFDEADALFGKRSEVKDSHDRYANIEVNYLLQKMEEHEGIVIMATNLSKNIDEAFSRRMHFSVDFPFPEKEERLLIWKHIFPKEVPLDNDIDFRFLARQLNITGGNIKNIALTSAFMAARDSGRLGMKHIMCAAKREFRKIGKLCVEADFKEYYQWVR